MLYHFTLVKQWEILFAQAFPAGVFGDGSNLFGWRCSRFQFDLFKRQ